MQHSECSDNESYQDLVLSWDTVQLFLIQTMNCPGAEAHRDNLIETCGETQRDTGQPGASLDSRYSGSKINVAPFSLYLLKYLKDLTLIV